MERTLTPKLDPDFKKSFYALLPLEGGYVNDPKDPGGPTNFGITQKTYDAYLALMDESPAPVKSISIDEVQNIYYNQYWLSIRANELPSGLNFAVFDCAVHSGPARATKILQGLVGEAQDGSLGTQTLAAVRIYLQNSKATVKGLIEKYYRKREKYLHSLAKWSTYSRGWTARIESSKDIAISMLYGDLGISESQKVQEEISRIAIKPKLEHLPRAKGGISIFNKKNVSVASILTAVETFQMADIMPPSGVLHYVTPIVCITAIILIVYMAHPGGEE